MSQSEHDLRGHNEGHVDEMSCLQYLEGLLERPRALELSAHTEHCSDCRALIHTLERETRMLSHALREQEEPLPARLRAGLSPERPPWGWIVSFGLAASGAYWLWTSIIDPWQSQLAQAGLGGTNLLSNLFIYSALWKGWGTMWTTVQALAMLSLGLVGFLLLRRSLRRWNTIALVMTALVVALGMPSATSAMEFHKKEPNYTLPADKTVKDDLMVVAQSVRIDGTVDGDLILIGQSFTINGHVTGDVLVAGSLLTINGTVDGNVRGSLGVLSIHGKVGKNILGFVGTMTTDPQSEIGWRLDGYVAELSLDGKIGRGISAHTGQAELNGFVGGDVSLKAKEYLHVGPQAQLQGKVDYTGPIQPVVAEGSKLANPINVNIEAGSESPDYIYSGMSLWHKILYWGASFTFGLVLLFVAPGFFSETVQTADRFGMSLGVGAMVLIATPVIAFLVCLTVVGLAVGISSILLWIIGIYASKIFFCAWLGKGIVNWVKSVTGGSSQTEPKVFARAAVSGAAIGHLALGLAVLYAIRAVPYVGFLLVIASVFWGFGAMAITLFNRMRPSPVAIAA